MAVKTNNTTGNAPRRKCAASIIICTYNNKDVIAEALESVAKQSFTDYECILVDDCSTDGTVELVKKKFPWVKLVRKTKQTGPSISRNIGAKMAFSANSEFIVFMDSDVALEKDWLSKQIKLFKKLENESLKLNAKTKPGIIGGKLLYKSNGNRINSAGGGLMTCGIGFDIGRGKNAKMREYGVQKNVMYACSAAILVSTKMLREIGVFDETFFYGHEDTDLGWRGNIAGYNSVYNPNAVAYHNVGDSMQHQSAKLYYYSTKNRIRAMLKNYEWYNIFRFLPLLLMLTIGDIVFRNFKIVKTQAVWWNLTNIFDTLKERKKVQKQRKIKDAEIMKMIDNSWKLFKQ